MTQRAIANRLMLTIAATMMSACAIARPSRAILAAPPAALRAEAVTFASKSGSVIHAWLSRGRAHGGVVLLLHGMGENRTAMMARAEFLHREGFTVLAPDFQGNGESLGDHVTFGARESLDAAAALAFVRDSMPGERVGVIGVSMGGAATLLGPGPVEVNALVLESVYPTIRDAVSDRLATWFGPFSFVGRLFTSPAIGILGNETGVNESELQPIARIGALHAPLLLISGADDPYTRLAEAESLYAHAPSPKSFWAVDGAGHEDLHAYAPVEYQRRVGGFLAGLLRSDSVAVKGKP